MSILSILPISATKMIPLSAEYRYDENITFGATQNEYMEGYNFIKHPIFHGGKDVAFARDSFFGITSANLLSSLLTDEISIDPLSLVFYTSFKASNNLYITNINNELFATATEVTSSEFFRVTRNVDGTCGISQNNLYATIITENNNFSITMMPKLESDPYNLQKFIFYTAGSNQIYTIKTLFYIPEWSPYITKPIERFLSYEDKDNSNRIKSIGMVPNGNYTPENRYEFLTNYNWENSVIIGYNGNVIWVKYYNDITQKFYNRTTDIEDIINNVRNNYLVEYPYKTQIDNITPDSGRMKVNLITLKNIMTPEYRYAVKQPRPVENIEIIEDEEDFEILNGIPDGKTFVLDGFINGGFETGDFTGWTRTQGYWFPDYPSQVFSDTYFEDLYGPGTGFSPFDDSAVENSIFPDLRAGGTLQGLSGNKAARINNALAGLNTPIAEGGVIGESYDLRFPDWDFLGYRWSTISQTVTNWTHSTICFAYNAVLQDPANGHHNLEDPLIVGYWAPKFVIKLYDETTSTVIYEVDTNVFEELLVPGGWKSSSYPYENWKYSDWQTVVLNTSLLIGHNLTLSISAYDCAWGGDGGYVYVDNFGYVE